MTTYTTYVVVKAGKPVLRLPGRVMRDGTVRLTADGKKFQPVAIKTGEKAPLNRGWQTFNGLPAYSPISANTGVNCSPLRAIDIDIDDQQAAQTAVALAVEQLGATPLVRFRSGSPRRLLVYRGSGLKRIVKTQAGKVEILGKGQQFVAFGVHPDGSDFDWEGETPASFSLADLPEATPDAEQAFADALIAALGGVETVESPSPAPSPFRPVVVSDSRLGESVGFREINDLALARLASWVPAIFPGAKHQAGTGAYRVSSRQLGRSLQEDLSLAPTGIVDFGVADMGDARSGKRTPIDTVMQWGGAPDPIQAALWLADKLGVKFQTDRDEVPVTVVEAVAGMVEGKAKAAIPAIPFAEIDFAEGVDWTRPAGVLGEIVEWILATSRRPNRPLAVASATAIVSTVCGRHLYGPTGSALNVYIACLGDSGIGKGRPLAAISEVLKAAGLAGY